MPMSYSQLAWPCKDLPNAMILIVDSIVSRHARNGDGNAVAILKASFRWRGGNGIATQIRFEATDGWTTFRLATRFWSHLATALLLLRGIFAEFRNCGFQFLPSEVCMGMCTNHDQVKTEILHRELTDSL